MACNSSTAGRGAKLIEIWDSEKVVLCIWDTFDLLVFKVILGHSVHMSQNCLQLKNGWAIERNGVKFGTRGAIRLKVGFQPLVVISPTAS